MLTTPNLGLKKPGGTDLVDIADLNDNMDKLDTEVTRLATTSQPGRQSAADKTKLDGIAVSANNYSHPANHPPAIITQDASNRFTTDAEKTAWNAKQAALGFVPENPINKGANNGYAGLDSTGRLLTANIPVLPAANLSSGAATDTVIGNRTIDDTATPSTGPNTPTNLWSFLGNRIKNITGETTWITSPLITLKTLYNKFLNSGGHGHTGVDGDGPKLNPTTALTYVPLNKAGDTATNLLLTADPTLPLGAVTKQFTEINFPKKSIADTTYYVLKTGSDSNTGLAPTAGGAFLTIAKAISMIPQIVNHTYKINVGIGTYAEDLVISSFTGSGTLWLSGAGAALSDNYIINSVTTKFCSANILVQGIKGISIGNAFNGAVSSNVIYDFCKADVSALAAYACRFDACLATISNCSFSNRYATIDAESNSRVYSVNNSGAGNTFGLAAHSNSTIGKYGTQSTATTQEIVDGGAMIGSSVGVINPWGDNTAANRSTVRATPSGNQSLIALQYTKVTYDNELVDRLNEYDFANSRYVPKTAGVILVSARLFVPAGAGQRCILAVYKNNVEESRLTDLSVGGVFVPLLSGTAHISVGVGDFLEIFVYSAVGGATSFPASQVDYIKIA